MHEFSTVVLADDDAIIRRGLSQMMPWKENNLALVGVAADGEEALALLRTHKPNILITDVKMPFMDGIALAEKARAELPDLQIILLSAYEEFNYAKKALQFRVYDYLIKPVETAQLLEVVLAAVNEQKLKSHHKRQQEMGLPLLRQQALRALVCDHATDAQQHKVLELDLNLYGAYFVVIAVRIDEYYTNHCEGIINGALLKYGVENICAELVTDSGAGELLCGTTDTFFVIINTSHQEINRVYALMQNMQTVVQEHLHTGLSIGIGNFCSRLKDLSQSCEQANWALGHRHLVGKGHIVLFSSVEEPYEKTTWDLQEWNQAFVKSVSIGKFFEAQGMLKQQKTRMSSGGFVSLENVHLALIGTAALLFQQIGNWSSIEINTDYYYFSLKLNATQTVAEAFDVLEALADGICNAVNNSQESSRHLLAKKAELYVKQHFFKSTLTLQEVADANFVSSVYLSIVFKQIKQINFSDYLYELRMLAAIELIESTSLKAYEVGERVGYPNANYFSVLFKKRFGCAVSEYRNNLRISSNLKAIDI